MNNTGSRKKEENKGEMSLVSNQSINYKTENMAQDTNSRSITRKTRKFKTKNRTDIVEICSKKDQIWTRQIGGETPNQDRRNIMIKVGYIMKNTVSRKKKKTEVR